MDRLLMWTGAPLVYQRPGGHGIVVGAFHYLFSLDGRLESMQPVSRPVIQTLVGSLYPNPGALLAAHLKPIPLREPEVDSEQRHLRPGAAGSETAGAVRGLQGSGKG